MPVAPAPAAAVAAAPAAPSVPGRPVRRQPADIAENARRPRPAGQVAVQRWPWAGSPKPSDGAAPPTGAATGLGTATAGRFTAGHQRSLLDLVGELKPQDRQRLAALLWTDLKPMLRGARMEIFDGMDAKQAEAAAWVLWPAIRELVPDARMDIVSGLSRKENDVLAKLLFPSLRRYLNADLMSSRIRSGHVTDGPR